LILNNKRKLKRDQVAARNVVLVCIMYVYCACQTCMQAAAACSLEAATATLHYNMVLSLVGDMCLLWHIIVQNLYCGMDRNCKLVCEWM